MINFLNPSILIAAVAAAIPLIIHFLNKRRVKRVQFSTVHFLKQMEKKQIRSLRLRQLLLLLLRTLIILALVASFARPTLQSGNSTVLGERSRIEAVILLDNSLSINEVRMTGSLLDDLRRSFVALADNFRSGDRITVIQATQPLKVLSDREGFYPDLWKTILPKIQSNYLRTDLKSALYAALERFRQSTLVGKELYIISDFQKTSGEEKTLRKLISENQTEYLKVFLVPIRHQNNENISVDSVNIVNRLIESGQTLKIKVRINNHYSKNFANRIVSLSLNNRRVGQQNISLPAAEPREIQFSTTLKDMGFVVGMIETENDALLEDNRYYFNFFVPREIRILQFVPDKSFQTFVPLLLEPASRKGLFKFTQQAFANWQSFNFFDYDLLIIEGIETIPRAFVNRLQVFIRQGGGVIVIPAGKVEKGSYQNLLSQLGLGKLGNVAGTAGSEVEFHTIHQINWKDPLFEGLFEGGNPKINPIKVFAHYTYRPQRGDVVLLKMSDGSPYFVRKVVDKGIVFFLTSPLQTRWTQLPFKGFVVPLLYRSIYYAGTQKTVERLQIRSGEEFIHSFSNLRPPFNFLLKMPGNQEQKLMPEFRGSGVILKTAATELPGNYFVYQNDKLLTVFSVNHWPQESEMSFWDDEELAKIFPDAVLISDPENAAKIIKQARLGKELWKQFLILAFILLLLEMVVARTGTKKEFEEYEMEELLKA